VNRTGVSDASSVPLLLGLAAVRLAIQFAGINHYGFFRDELYYMACGEHLAWGYVDQPPLIALLAWLVRHTLGDSMLAIRLLPALAGAATVFLTACWPASSEALVSPSFSRPRPSYSLPRI